ncbi:MAG: MFS transporter [Geminicoccaceae bacterium]|nr:MAG: MFS transporter [Geminicoccaceae bacterium]
MRDWGESLKIYLDRRIAIILVLGFASGLPVPLVFSNLSIWLRDVGVSRTEIGLFALVATPYAINFLWAPLVDRLRLPFFTARFGRRRGWALCTQILLFLALVVLSRTNPGEALYPVALACILVSFFSATQDVVIDAYRIDVLEPEKYGAGSAAAIWGWHLGGTLIGGAGGLYLAAAFGWNVAYLVIAFTLGIGMAGVWLAPEPPAPAEADATRRRVDAGLKGTMGANLAAATAWLYVAVVAPFVDFMQRRGWLLILVFVFVFKLGDALLGRMSGVFYREMGFELTEIAHVAKVYGLAANAVGILIGGFLVHRWGTLKALFVGGLAAAATNLTYSWLALSGQSYAVFVTAVVADNFTGGLATVAFVAYLSNLCTIAYSATQYALLASLGNLARIWFSASAGWMVDELGGDWALFFAITAGIALLGLPLLLVLIRLFPEGSRPRRLETAAA